MINKTKHTRRRNGAEKINEIVLSRFCPIKRDRSHRLLSDEILLSVFDIYLQNTVVVLQYL